MKQEVLKIGSARELRARRGEIREVETLTLSGRSIRDKDLEFVPEGAHIHVLQLVKTGVRGPGLAALARPFIGSLQLFSNKFSRGGLKSLAQVGASRLVLNGNDLDPADLSVLCEMPNLESLFLAGPQIGESGLKALADCPKLTRLSINGVGLADRDMLLLAQLPRLERLSLARDRITDAGLENLVESPSMDHLRLMGLPAKGMGLAKHGRLTSLQISGLPLTSEGCAVIGSLSGLKELSLLNIAGLSDDVFKSLVNLTGLENLAIGACPISAAGLEPFLMREGLKRLMIDKSLHESGVAGIMERRTSAGFGALDLVVQ